MSFDHWWAGFFIDESAYERLIPNFVEAAEKAVLSPASQQALTAWRNRPSDFDENASASSPATATLANAFIFAFNLPGFDEFAEQLLVQGGRLVEFAGEKNVFRMAMTARHTPVSILWQALGAERAGLLPGRMGNLLLNPCEVAEAQEQTRRAFAGTSPPHLLDAARRYCGSGVGDEALRQVLDFLPEGLMRAIELRLDSSLSRDPRFEASPPDRRHSPQVVDQTFASMRSRVSSPSVNRLWTGAMRSRASPHRPSPRHTPLGRKTALDCGWVVSRVG